MGAPKRIFFDFFSEKVIQYYKFVDDAKHNTQWRKQFMDFEHYMSLSFRQGKEEGHAEGLTEGAKQKGIEIAKNAIKIGLPEKQIAEITGLSPESILELKEQSHANA